MLSSIQKDRPSIALVVLYSTSIFVAVICGVLASFVSAKEILLGTALIAAACLLFAFPEFALSLFVFAGIMKVAPRLSGIAAVDLTLALATLLVVACAWRIFRRETRAVLLPRAYVLYIPILLMMLFSLFYTPDLAAGVDKCARFFFLTGLAIVAPFILLDSPRKVQNFLYALAVISFVISSEALTRLSGRERLTTEGGLTIQLGVTAGVAIAIFWTMLLPRYSFSWRLLLLPLLIVPGIALIGSGARGATIGVVCCLVFGLVAYRFLLADAALLGITALLSLAFIPIPQASYRYLETLLSARSLDVLGFRNDLMALAWKLIRENPLQGVGIAGYPSHSPNPQIYGWPHNIFLELAAELGIPIALAFAILVVWSFRTAIAQVRRADFPLRNLSVCVLSLLIFGFIQMIKSGDINDNRSMWLYLGLPFLLQSMSGTLLQRENSSRSTPDSAFVNVA